MSASDKAEGDKRDGTATGTTGYGDKSYWDARYGSQDEKYDWYLGYPQLKPFLLPPLHVADNNPNNTSSSELDDSLRRRAEVKVLVVGCGNSDLSRCMFEDGFTDMDSIDYSTVVIDKMNALHQHIQGLTYTTMDVRELTYPNHTFDCIIDKGTLDAILCGSDSAKNAAAMLQEIHRVLKPGGVFFVITYGQPQSRLIYLDKPRYGWKVSQQVLGKTRFMYTMTRT